jgi:hypothetical protein
MIFFTAFNSVSSRSHLFIIFKNTKFDNELALIDLAGNEPNWKSSTEAGQERIFINSSLFDMSEMFRQIKSVCFL